MCKITLAADVDLGQVAAMTTAMTGADLANLVQRIGTASDPALGHGH